MFTLPPAAVAESRAAATSAFRSAGRETSPARSRTPSRIEEQRRDASSTARSTVNPWTTGNPKADEWIVNTGLSKDVLMRLAAAPQHKRLRFILSTIERNPQNPDAWVNACISNWRNQSMAHELLGTASVHSSERSRLKERCSPDRAPPRETVFHRAQEERPPPRVQIPAAATKPAEEALAMKNCWPDNRSNMISTLVAILDEANLDRFLELSPEDQCAMCFAFMVCATNEDTLSEKNGLVQAWLDRLDHFHGAAGRSIPRTISSSQTGARIHLQLVLAGMPSIMAGTVVSVLRKVAPTLHKDIAVEVAVPIYLETLQEDHVAIEHAADAWQQPFHPKIHTLTDLANEFEAMMATWQQTNTKFIFVANLGILSTPDVKVKDLEVIRLHQSDTEWIWAFSQAAQLVRERIQDHNVAEIFLGPDAQTFHGQIGGIWGEVTAAHAAGHPKIPVTMPQVYSTPSGFTVLSVVKNEALEKEPTETWQAGHFTAWMERYPGVAIAPYLVSKLMITKLFKERSLNKEEEDMLKAVAVKTDGCSTISMGRDRFLTLYGYKETPMEKLLEKELPCSENVISTTGDPSPSRSSKATFPCGKMRYCRQCEKVFALIGQSYPTYVVGDIILALFTKIAPTWSGKIPVETAMWARKDHEGRKHVCGPTCQGNL